jgi:hypothetical protein
MQICATDTRTANANDHVHRARNLRVRHVLVFDKLFRRQFFIKGMEHRGFHLFISPVGGFYFFGCSASEVNEQDLCQADNRLIFLTFSAF